MPKGAVLSPPESASSGSDDEEGPQIRGRQIENLKELKDAISQIPQRRESSPTKHTTIAGDLHGLQLKTRPESAVEGMQHSFSTGSLVGLAEGVVRRISHARSSTEPSVQLSKSAETSLTASDDESDSETRRKPQMVRKKSGELVRPALRPPSRRRPSSMPGTPIFSKSVHFDSHEHVRHFLQVDRPLAVSAGSSPVDSYESDNEYPFPGEERPGARSPPYEWEIVTTNFPTDTPIRMGLPVKVERVWLSNDQKCLMGSVSVANLAFQKFVTCRFTLDYWKTTSEVAAEYSHEIRPTDGSRSDHDRFNFTIKLSDLANLESKTLYFCMRYNVNGQEYWDSNNGTNFQIDFRKKHLPQNGKKNFQGASARPVGALPRSNRRASPSTAPRPKSMPVGALDEFGDKSKFNFDQPIHEYLGEQPSALRLKSNKSTSSLPSDNLSSRLSAPSGQAFANRYDFGASLASAVQAAKDSMGKERDGLYMKYHKKATNPERQQSRLAESVSDPTGMVTETKAPAAASGTLSPNSTLPSTSYEELVNKYCFVRTSGQDPSQPSSAAQASLIGGTSTNVYRQFGSKQSSPQIKDGTLRGGRYLDGAGDDSFNTRGTNSTNSSLDGSPQMVHHAGAAAHHALHLRDPNPYFHHTNLGGLNASPTASPLRNIGPSLSERSASPTKMQRPANTSVPSTLRSSSPASMVGTFAPFAGTSPNEFPYTQNLQERFPFASTEAHTATASCG
jgi:hypothetical protein